MAARVLVSAGEASGDLYAAALVRALRKRSPELEFWGCAGPAMQAAGVEPVVDSASLAVAGLVEVVWHLPRIYREYRKIVRRARLDPPAAAILTDSPDFHLRVAAQLKKQGIPVIYLVAPQAWAWRKDRLPVLRRTVDRLLCIFPFEEAFFREHGVSATYIGHPLTRMVRPSASRVALRERFGVPPHLPLIALLPGSREGELHRHLPALLDAVQRIAAEQPASFILALPKGFSARADLSTFRERFSALSIQILEGETRDVLAGAELALAASGTVTVEACLLGTPMVTFYRVTPLSWRLGKLLVRVPFYSMVNLIAGERVVPELIQSQMTGANIASEALRLLHDRTAREQMIAGLASVSEKLAGPEDPIDLAAGFAEAYLKKEEVHVA